MSVMPLSFMHNKEGGYPLGGSLKFARAIEKKYLTKEVHKFYDKPLLWPPLLSISLGVNRDLSDIGEINDIKLKAPITIGGKEVYWTGFFHYCHDPSFAPKGKSVIQSQIETDYSYWKELYDKDIKGYNNAKNSVLELYIKVLNNIFPGIEDEIEERDIATPVTWERYTGNWKGSYEGWIPTVKTFGITLPKKLLGLHNLYMTGQWISPGGGVPMCMSQARNIVNMIVEEDLE